MNSVSGTEKPPVDLFHRMQDETDIMRSVTLQIKNEKDLKFLYRGF